MPTKHTITVNQLAAALRHWEREAKDKNWKFSDRKSRHIQNAEYLLGLIAAAPAPQEAA